MLITNFNRNKKERYMKAVKEFRKVNPKTSLYVDNNAYTAYGKDENMCALRLSGYREDLSDFWEIYDSIDN